VYTGFCESNSCPNFWKYEPLITNLALPRHANWIVSNRLSFIALAYCKKTRNTSALELLLDMARKSNTRVESPMSP